MYCFENCDVLFNVLLKEYTSFKTGGIADIMLEPKTPEAVAQIMSELSRRGEKYFVLGNGSNLLAADEGIRNPIIHIGKNMRDIRVEDDRVICRAGALLSAAAKIAYQNSLTGMEFAAGIPGSVGGAVYMNAGAYGGEMKDIVDWIDYAAPSGEVYRMDGDSADFGYRKSFFTDNKYVICTVCLKLKKGNKDEIMEKMKELGEKRRSKQPLEYPSAGSTFKRPEGYYAAALIEEAGLKGVSEGGAQVSEKHAGFIINKGNATTRDIINLMEVVKKKVKEVSGVDLEAEVKLWE